MIKLSFPTKLWLFFGTNDLFLASFGANLKHPPFSGLEYASEKQVKTFDDFEVFDLNDAKLS